MVAIPKPGREPCVEEQFLADVVALLRQRVRAGLFDTWFSGLRIARLVDDEVEFTVPNGFTRDWIARNYLSYLEQTVAAAGNTDRRVRITPAANGATPSTSTTKVAPAAAEPAEAPTDPDASEAKPTDELAEMRRIAQEVQQTFRAFHEAYAQSAGTSPTGGKPRGTTDSADAGLFHDGKLNDRYTFDEFVVGPCNSLTHAAALAVAQSPGNSYNPLFVHGNVGLGKTHALQAICHYIKRSRPGTRVIYLSCEDFTNRYIAAIQNRSAEAFRAYHRSADVLVIDDVEFLAKKDQTQEEFFHTFNELYNQKKQIILSSDREPDHIPTLEERLVSRFRWGLCAEMTQPSFETRMAIVRRKGNLAGTEIPDDVARFIAEEVTSNIRELEGAVTNVVAKAAITGCEMSLDTAREIMQRTLPSRPQAVTLSAVMALITSEFSLSAKDLRGKSRTQNISGPRQIGMYLARQLTDASLEEVGRFFGNRDHTTVLYAVRKVQKRVEDDRLYGELVDRLIARLQRGERNAG